jgi:hypothetical protein
LGHQFHNPEHYLPRMFHRRDPSDDEGGGQKAGKSVEIAYFIVL